MPTKHASGENEGDKLADSKGVACFADEIDELDASSAKVQITAGSIGAIESVGTLQVDKLGHLHVQSLRGLESALYNHLEEHEELTADLSIADVNGAISKLGGHKLAPQNQSSLDTILAMAEGACRAWNYSDAISYYQRANELVPENAAVLYGLCEAYAGIGECGTAVEHLRQATELIPEDAYSEVSYDSIEWLVKHGKGDELKGIAEEAVCKSPCAQTWALRSEMLVITGIQSKEPLREQNFREAVSSAEEAIKADPKRPEGWFRRGHAYYELCEFAKAVGEYDVALAIDPKDATAWRTKGDTLLEISTGDGRGCPVHGLWRAKGDFLPYTLELAVECYKKSLEIQPEYAAAWRGKGCALHSMGKYAEAINCYSKVIEIYKRFSFMWFNKAQSALEQLSAQSAGNALAAYDAYFTKAQDTEMRRADAIEELGRAYSASGREELAKTCISAVAQIINARADGYNSLISQE